MGRRSDDSHRGGRWRGVLALSLALMAAPALAQAAGQSGRSVAQLRAEVAQLRLEVAQLQRQLVELEQRAAPETGTGGSAAAGGEDTAADEALASTANVLYLGTIRSLSPEAMLLEDEQGNGVWVKLGPETEVIRGAWRVGFDTLKEGQRVRASIDVGGMQGPMQSRSPAERVVVLEPEKDSDAPGRRR